MNPLLNPKTNKPYTMEEIQQIVNENNALRTAGMSKKLTLKVSEKGGLSVYGLQRFPVTFYKEQWTKLIAEVPAIEAFLKAHDSQLRSKADAVVIKSQAVG